MNCSKRKESKFEKVEVNHLSSIGMVIAVMSGKGGVGKSSVTSLLAMSLNKSGKKVGILDADFTGPSIPKIFGLNSKMAKTGPVELYRKLPPGG